MGNREQKKMNMNIFKNLKTLCIFFPDSLADFAGYQLPAIFILKVCVFNDEKKFWQGAYYNNGLLGKKLNPLI